MKILILIVGVAILSQININAQSLTKHVNLFIGTTDEGNLIPGATMPFGMVQLSPDTDIKKPSGYNYQDSVIIGFSHTHLSGTGLGDLGDILTMPFSNSVSGFEKKLPDFSSQFSHANESASPGYYSVFLDKLKTKVELTATNRCGFQRYSYSANQAFQGVFLDLKHTIYGSNEVWTPDLVYDCQLTVEDNFTICGYKKSKGWAPEQHAYFVMKFNHPIADYFVKHKNSISNKLNFSQDSTLQAVFLFSNTNELLIKTGISSTSIDGARKNLNAEISDWGFDKCRQEASAIWEKYLQKIEIKADNARKELFYTALYHTFVTPNLISDVDSTFFGPDFKIHKTRHGNYYSTFSLWDTYRAVHPLYTLICPDKNAEFVNSMLEHFKISGRLPIWTLWGTENYCMTGNHAIPVIVDAFLKGIKNIDTDLAWKAIYSSATNHLPRINIELQKNFGYDWIDKYGYMPHDSLRGTATSLLELCYDDWCISQMATKLNKKKEADFFLNRSQYYKNIFDKKIGFVRPRLANGNWQTPFDPFSFKDWQTSAFVEGNSFQYTLYVPHQLDTLISFLGGSKKFEAKLDTLFGVQNKVDDPNFTGNSGYIGLYQHGNEPSHHIAYLYNQIGKQDKTAEKIHQIMKTQYSHKPSGLCGNDDCGQMSAWYVFTALGFYPVNPADGKYWFGTSQLKSATLNLENGKQFKINYHSSEEKNSYIQKIELNKKSIPLTSIKHADILKGGVMDVYMGKEPAKGN